MGCRRGERPRAILLKLARGAGEGHPGPSRVGPDGRDPFAPHSASRACRPPDQRRLKPPHGTDVRPQSDLPPEGLLLLRSAEGALAVRLEDDGRRAAVSPGRQPRGDRRRRVQR
ncbi:MAG: hypothetical protein ACK55Z_28340, partial [bacterium]